MLARQTDWQDKGGISIALGQRIIATDAKRKQAVRFFETIAEELDL